MGKPVLSIIVTHYDEPWELGKPFFDMLDHQQCLDYSKVEIILVQDGEYTALPFDTLLSGYGYKTKIISLKQNMGTATARNTGLDNATGDWVIFCNFDDMLADVCSLSMMIDNFPTDEYDIIWMKIARQSKWFSGHIYINKVDEADFSRTDGKMYRRQFLTDNDIRFLPSPRMFYDHMFNSVALAIAEPFRICMLSTDFYPYFKTFRQDSFRHTLKAHQEMIDTSMQRDIAIVNDLQKRGKEFEYRRSIAKTVCKEFYAIYDPEKEKNKDQLTPGFAEFYRQHRDAFKSVSKVDIDSILGEAEIEQMNEIQNIYNEHKQELYFRNDSMTFDQWVESIDKRLADEKQQQCVVIPNDPVVCTRREQPETLDRNARIVVYCGTYDVYMNMMASAKSVLCNMPVDKIYFLIEDDKFPYDLPDIIETVNVKDQQYFPPDGPNYDNSWTWMCMIRAAYPELFPQYSRVLSLDIDIVVNDNVTDLWDYDVSDYHLAGVPERQRQKSISDPMYINFGVVMMNLDRLRQDNIQEQVINILNTQKVDCPEQGAYNKACAGHILELPADFNYTAYSHITGDAQKERIIHYAGQKFWRHYSVVKQYADLSWDTVMERQDKLHE